MKNAVLVPLSLYTIGLYNDHVNEETGLFDLQSFNHALTEHDNEIISEIEKLIAIEKQEMMDKKKELKKEKIMEMWDSWETYYGGRTTALTEIINLIKGKK